MARYPNAGNIAVDPTGIYPNMSRYPNAGEVPVDPTGLYPNMSAQRGSAGMQPDTGTQDLINSLNDPRYQKEGMAVESATPLGGEKGQGAAGMSSAQAAQILAGINPDTGQYDPSIANNAELIAQARIAFGYDTPTGAAGPRTVGGTPTTSETPGGVADLLGAPSARGQFTPGFQTGLTGTGDAPMGGQPLNERLYADEPTTEWLAQQLGGTVTNMQGAAYPGGANPNTPTIRLPDGRLINAGEMATFLKSQQTPYQQGVENYQRNRGGTAPLTPLERLKMGLKGEGVYGDQWGPQPGAGMGGNDPYVNQYEAGAEWNQQAVPAGYQRPPQFQRGDDFNAPGAGGGYGGGGPNATQPAWQQPSYPGLPPQGSGQQPGGQSQPYPNFGGYGGYGNMGGYGGMGGGYGNQRGPMGFGGGLNFAMAPNSLYYPNMRGNANQNLGSFPYTGGGMNFGGGFPGGGGGYGQFQNPLAGFGNMGGFANFNNATQNYMQQPWSQGRNMYNRAPQF